MSIKGPLHINDWWRSLKNERYWMEITGRPDIGSDLKAPQFKEDGESETYSYSLLKHVSDGDVVFHYFKAKKAIIGFSVVDGNCYEDDIIWRALGSSAVKIGGDAYIRPGWKAGLKNFQEFDPPLTLAQLRAKSSKILEIREALKSQVVGALYFPFAFDKENQLYGAVQGYLIKFPSAIVQTFPQLEELNAFHKDLTNETGIEQLGTEYRTADENVAISKHQPFEIDPDVVDRGSRAHRKVQNLVATTLQKHGIGAESPSNNSVNFDIAWRRNHTYFIAEVKSVTAKNAEKQMRQGLGQVLRYSSLVKPSKEVRIQPVLIVEKIFDETWYQTCAAVGVELIEAADVDRLLRLG